MSMTLEACPFPPLQRAALKRAYELICKEDENTEYQDIAPVNKMMQMICRFHAEGPESDAVRRHVEKLADFMWLGQEGMMVTGTNGSQVWDAGFIAQALVETGIADIDENRESAMRMLDWLDKAQMTDNPKHPQYRHPTKGTSHEAFASILHADYIVRCLGIQYERARLHFVRLHRRSPQIRSLPAKPMAVRAFSYHSAFRI